MRRALLAISLSFCICIALTAQITSYDRLTFAGQDLIGTSRYVGMGGAMAAVGGDASAASDNPAGLGLYRRSELMLTLDLQMDYPSSGLHTNKFSCGQASWNFCFLNDRMKGVVSNNVMLHYRRLKNFYRDYNLSATNTDFSQTDIMADKTNGLKETYLQGEDAWNDTEIGWLSKIGYEGYLIDPDSVNPEMWNPSNLSSVNGKLHVQESGSMDEFAIGWGMNISNQWYVGAEMGIRSLSYSKSSYYNEVFGDGGRYHLDSYLNASGVGFVSKIGLLYRPTSFLRLGAAFHAPVPMAVTLRNYGDLQAKNGMAVSVQSPDYTESPRDFAQPMRVVTGLAFQISTKGLLSLEYDYQHDPAKGVLDTHWTKVGLEAVIANNWFFNIGYAMRFRSFQNGQWADPITEINYNSARTDTEFANLKNAHFLSGGVSFRHKYVIIGAAYQCRLMTENVHFHELHYSPVELATTSHKIVFTLSWRN